MRIIREEPIRSHDIKWEKIVVDCCEYIIISDSNDKRKRESIEGSAAERVTNKGSRSRLSLDIRIINIY